MDITHRNRPRPTVAGMWFEGEDVGQRFYLTVTVDIEATPFDKDDMDLAESLIAHLGKRLDRRVERMHEAALD